MTLLALAAVVQASGAARDIADSATLAIRYPLRGTAAPPQVIPVLSQAAMAGRDLSWRADSGADTPVLRVHADRVHIGFDGWLENRDDLALDLSLAHASDRGSTAVDDATLVALAWERWGDAAFARMYGEYALILADSARGCLVAVRDKVGVRPLHYATWPGGAAVGNFPAGLASLPQVGRGLDGGFAAEFLVASVNSVRDTLFANVKTVLGGELLYVRADGTAEVRRYWCPEALPQLTSRGEAVAQVQQALSRAVTAAASGVGSVACQVSGGIDSSSVAATLSQLRAAGAVTVPVMGVAGIYPGLPCDESCYIDAVADGLGFPVQRVPATYPDVAAFRQLTDALGYPVYPFTATSSVDHFLLARQAGAATLLTGEGGDELFWPTANAWRGFSLCSSTDLRLLWREVAAGWGETPATASLAGRAHGALRCLLGQDFANRVWHRRHSHHVPSGVISAKWMEDVGLATRLHRLSCAPVARTDAMSGALSGFRTNYAWLHWLAAAHGIEYRHPLQSARLIELANRMPLAWLDHRDRITRQPLREAMAGRLPELCLLRRDKAEFTSSVLPAITAMAEAVRASVAHSSGRTSGWWFRLDPHGDRYVWRPAAAVALAAWLQSGSAPQAPVPISCATD